MNIEHIEATLERYKDSKVMVDLAISKSIILHFEGLLDSAYDELTDKFTYDIVQVNDINPYDTRSILSFLSDDILFLDEELSIPIPLLIVISDSIIKPIR